MRIDGGTSVDERQTIVDNFNCRGVGQVSAAAAAAGSHPRSTNLGAACTPMHAMSPCWSYSAVSWYQSWLRSRC